MGKETKQPLIDKIALVTGATRGIGKGIALQLGQAGATVYITGRTLKSKNGLGSLEETATEIRNRGGKCIPVQVDHEDDEQVHQLFKKIENEQNGRLDILVNNAYKAVETIAESGALKFWEQPPEVWDTVNNVGLRNHYLCTVYAARLMVPRRQGLIVNISSFGGVRYLFNVAYGIGKAAVDRMAVDCGIELKKHNVACLSLYPGAVKTELIEKLVINRADEPKEEKDKENKLRLRSKTAFADAESIEYSGKVIVSLASNPKVMNYTARVVLAAEYAAAHGIRDIDDRVIPSLRQVNYLCKHFLPPSLSFVAKFIPNFVKVPQFVLDIVNSKF